MRVCGSGVIVCVYVAGVGASYHLSCLLGIAPRTGNTGRPNEMAHVNRLLVACQRNKQIDKHRYFPTDLCARRQNDAGHGHSHTLV